VGGVLPKFPDGGGSIGVVPGGATVNVGNGEGVMRDNVAVAPPGAVVTGAVSAMGVAVGRGCGGCRKVYTNPIPSRHSARIPQPSPANMNLSNVA
jgi:hypothetical protein